MFFSEKHFWKNFGIFSPDSGIFSPNMCLCIPERMSVCCIHTCIHMYACMYTHVIVKVNLLYVCVSIHHVLSTLIDAALVNPMQIVAFFSSIHGLQSFMTLNTNLPETL